VDASTVVLLCEGRECGFFRCRDLALEPGGVQLTRGGGGFMASPAAPAEIYRHAGELIYRFELLGPIVPYYAPRR
jgi:hypothetical protein